MGRKKLPDKEKKIPLYIYPKERDLEAVGGREKAQEIAENAIIKAGKTVKNG